MWGGATQGAWFEHPDLPGVLPHTLTAPPGALLLVMGKVGREAKESLKLLPYLCGCVVMISDKGEGTVGARSDGRADISYTFDPGDVARIKAGMVETARVLLAGGRAADALALAAFRSQVAAAAVCASGALLQALTIATARIARDGSHTTSRFIESSLAFSKAG